MTKQIWERHYYRNKDIDFFINNQIIEYDMKSAGLSLAKEYKYLDSKIIKKLDNMSKEEQSNFVTENGDMVLKPGFSHYYLLTSGLNKKLGDPDGYDIDFSSNPNFMVKFSITEYLEYTQPTAK